MAKKKYKENTAKETKNNKKKKKRIQNRKTRL